MKDSFNVSRRGFLTGVAALGAAAAAPIVCQTAGKPESVYAAEANSTPISFIPAESYEDGDVIEADLVVVGSGLAGLWAAISANDAGVKSVAVVDKGAIGFSSVSSLIAGSSVYVLPEDDVHNVMGELVKVADYLSRQDMWEAMLSASGDLYKYMTEEIGVEYKGGRMSSDGNIYTKMSRGATYGDIPTGRGLIVALTDMLRQRDGVRYFSKTMVTEVLKDGNRAAGVVGVNRMTGDAVAIKAKAVILATGQCSFAGQHALMEVLTGDGYALAYNAGATLNNMEFWAFDIDPVEVGFEGGSLLPMRGGRIINSKNEEFMWEVDPVNGAGADVRITTRAMAKQVDQGNGPIYMDRTTLQYQLVGQHGWIASLPKGSWRQISELRTKEVCYDVTKQPEMYTANSFGIIGAIKADVNCATDVAGLFAASVALSADPGKTKGIESARAMWSGRTAGTSAAAYIQSVEAPKIDDRDIKEALAAATAPLAAGALADIDTCLTPGDVLHRLQEIIFDYRVSLIPTEDTLVAALKALGDLEIAAEEMTAVDPHELVKYHETRNMLQNARLHLLASLERRESRVCHYRDDYRETDNENWLKWIEWTRGSDGEPVMSFTEVPIAEYPFKPEGMEA